MRKRLAVFLAVIAACIALIAVPTTAQASNSPYNNLTPTSANGYKWWQLYYSAHYAALNPGKPASAAVWSNRNPTWWIGSTSYGHYYEIFQSDCNDVVYWTGANPHAVWASNTVSSHRPCDLAWQSDGNRVIGDSLHHILFATGTTYGGSSVMWTTFNDVYGCIVVNVVTTSDIIPEWVNRLGC